MSKAHLAGPSGTAAQLHLIKLCVGAPSVEALSEWVASRARRGPVAHRTRRRPTRAAEILGAAAPGAGGSLYWVIGGAIRCRQRILDLPLETDEGGRTCCALHLEPQVIATEAWPRRPFQGWRYLPAGEAPPDLIGAAAGWGDDDDAPPPEMWAELAAVGVARP